MKAKNFIENYLSQCDDTIVCLHSPSNTSSSIFSIHEWREWGETPMVPYSQCEVLQILSRVENYHYNLAIVIHIYTEYPETAE